MLSVLDYLFLEFSHGVFNFFDFLNQPLNQRFGSISFGRGSGSGDPHLGKVDMDPRIHLSVIVDPDPRIHICKKWIRIRFQSGSGSGSKVDPDSDPSTYFSYFIFHKEIHVGQITMLPPKFRKGISQITKTFGFTFYCK